MEAGQRIDHLTPREKMLLARRLLLATGDADGQPVRLRAFVRWRDHAGHGSEALRAFLQERMPGHMVPAAIESVGEWPRLPNGKIDRQTLLSTERASPDSNLQLKVSEVPHNPRVGALLEIWRSLLGREMIGVNDDFFALGGHSLLAMQLGSRIHQVFDLEIPMHIFFEAPTVAKLADAIELQMLLRPAAARGRADEISREDGVI